jgi:hypothetical protein
VSLVQSESLKTFFSQIASSATKKNFGILCFQRAARLQRRLPPPSTDARGQGGKFRDKFVDIEKSENYETNRIAKTASVSWRVAGIPELVCPV